jgi:hypothetical protein
MAVVINPLLSQEAHGKVGGTEFRQIRGRSIVGRVSLATPKRTLHTNDARMRFDHAVKAWRNLSDADRALWALASGSPELGFQLWTKRAILTQMTPYDLPSATVDHNPPDPIESWEFYLDPPPHPMLNAFWDWVEPRLCYYFFYWQPQQRTSTKPSPYRWIWLGCAYPADDVFSTVPPQYAESSHARLDIVSPISGEVFYSSTRFVTP